MGYRVLPNFERTILAGIHVMTTHISIYHIIGFAKYLMIFKVVK